MSYLALSNKVSVHLCSLACKDVLNAGLVKNHKMANNLAESAQNGNNGTMHSEVLNPC